MRRLAVTIFGLMVATLQSVSAQVALTVTVPGGSEETADIFREAASVRNVIAGDDVQANEVLAAARSDYAVLLGAAYELGYFSTEVSIRADGREVALIPPLDSPTAVRQIDVTVRPGPRFSFGRARITPLPEDARLPEGFAPGKPAFSPVILDAADAALSDWRRNGFAKARINSEQVSAIHPEARLDVDIGIDPGRQLKFGDLTVSGNEDVRAERVAAIADLPTGAIYDPDRIDEVRRRLAEAGAFRSIVLREADTPNPDDTLDFTLDVEEEKKRRFGFGAEFETDEGGTVSGYWLHRNLFGGSEELRFDAEVRNIGATNSNIDYLIGTSLTRPATIDSKTRLVLRAKIEQEDDDFSLYQLGEVEAGLTRRISKTVDAGAALKLTYVDADFGTSEREYTLFSVPLFIQRDARRILITDPEEGSFLRLDVEPWQGINDTEPGVRFQFDARKYFPLTPEQDVIIASRFLYASIVGPDGLDVQPDFWLYSGGSGTVRGQPFEELGIFGSGDSVRVGRSLAVVNLEARYRMSDALGIVGFVDAGLIGPDATPSDDSLWHGGFGLGVRYATPIGPLRADLGLPITGSAPEPSSNFQLYIGIGQAF
ncbi:MAG: BamA/TamA family outer membrane protein [Pseudomonadota bacterium]